MAGKSDSLLSSLFNITPTQGLELGGGSILAASYLAKNPVDATLNNIFGIESSNKIINRTTANVLGVNSQLNSDLEGIKNDTLGAIKSRVAQVQNDIAQSATARGLDAKTAQASAEQFGASTSGAYAAAHMALVEAQAGATARMSGAMSNYYQGVAQQQLQNKIQEAANNAGILGTITGITSAIMANANMQPQPQQGVDITKGKNPYGVSNPQPTLQPPPEEPALPTDRTYPTASPFNMGLNQVQQGVV
jgi:hypothetical protein